VSVESLEYAGAIDVSPPPPVTAAARWSKMLRPSYPSY